MQYILKCVFEGCSVVHYFLASHSIIIIASSDHNYWRPKCDNQPSSLDLAEMTNRFQCFGMHWECIEMHVYFHECFGFSSWQRHFIFMNVTQWLQCDPLSAAMFDTWREASRGNIKFSEGGGRNPRLLLWVVEIMENVCMFPQKQGPYAVMLKICPQPWRTFLSLKTNHSLTGQCFE